MFALKQRPGFGVALLACTFGSPFVTPAANIDSGVGGFVVGPPRMYWAELQYRF
jgi:hypothetical protein